MDKVNIDAMEVIKMYKDMVSDLQHENMILKLTLKKLEEQSKASE